MTDEAKPPKKRPDGAAKRPRKPAADAAKRPRKAPAKAGRPEPAAEPEPETAAPAPEGAAADTPPEPVADADATVATPPDEAATAIVTPDDATTQVVAADAMPTQVLDGAATEPTQVLASAGGGAPPAFAPLPRVATPTGGDDRRTTLWLVLAVAAVAVLAVALVWAFALRDDGEQFVGNWAPVSGEGGGYVIEATDGGFDVSVYDAELALTGTYPATRDGDTLTFRFTDTQTQLGLVEATLTYVEDRDVLVQRLAATGEEGAAVEFVRVDALQAAATPSPTPMPTSTPTASPTASPSGSPSLTPSPTSTDTTQYDGQVQNGIVAIQVGVLNWAQANGNLYPPVGEVTQSGGVAQYVSPWPTNPFTGQPMAPGDQEGDYTYEQLNGGQGYKIIGHLTDGLPFTVP